MMVFAKVIVLGWTLLNLSTVWAQSQPPPSYKDYYMISQVPRRAAASTSVNPVQTLGQVTSLVADQVNGVFNLLSWDRAGKPLPPPNKPYNRVYHFGAWIDDGRDSNCLDTRGKILARTSKVPVKIGGPNNCFVVSGEWNDPYTGQTFRDPQQIQIDHFVPLKAAYTTGAWKWDYKTRCLYGNFLFNGLQLLSVSGKENQAKSDKSPAEYLPPNRKIWCAYVSNWLKIKLIWNLALTPPEAQAISDVFKQQKCNIQDFQLTLKDMKEQRGLIQANHNYCDFNVKKPNQGSNSILALMNQ